MKVPTVGGKISTTKPEQTSGSTLKSATTTETAARGGAKAGGGAKVGGATEKDGPGQAYKVIGNLGKRQSESLMDVTIIKNKSGGGCRGGADDRMDPVAEIALPPLIDGEMGGASAEVGDGHHDQLLVPNGGAVHGQEAGAELNEEDDRQVIGQRFETYRNGRSPRSSNGSEIFNRLNRRGLGNKLKHCLRK
ncbi:hypothetical protein ElyMa_005926100 [Elysia marginata]|uniref:Uncharacterized protein n=1 Tax=Elysia marginata TaxID=1093978 RepID=A0AAV4GA00_9GAST|nr:hypothetical protein ElyMa_005926100 [Elysia marginata]